VVLYGFETWALVLWEEHRLRVFENRVLRRIFGHERNEVMGGFRELHDVELCDMHSSLSIIRIIKWRRMRWEGHVVQVGEERNLYRLLVGELEGKRPLRGPRCGWVDNIKMDLVAIGWDGVDWLGLAQDKVNRRAVVNVVVNLCVP
jgi:hypothetical protein